MMHISGRKSTLLAAIRLGKNLPGHANRSVCYDYASNRNMGVHSQVEQRPAEQADRALKLSDCQVQLIGKALADPRRYEILRKLGSNQCTVQCSDMRACIDISPATLSHHMKELETAGLVRSEKEGKFVRYFTETEVLFAYLDRLRTDLA
jgi:ArsR family transcriptional regulator